jgi:hypothetical protein
MSVLTMISHIWLQKHMQFKQKYTSGITSN